MLTDSASTLRLQPRCMQQVAKLDNKALAVCLKAENPFVEELKATAKYIAQRGRGILASDESNVTTGKRLESVGVENTEDNRRAWRELLYTAPG